MPLVIEQIHKSFGAKVAVDRLSLSVEDGQICGIIGPNGAGKTTSIRMIMNITRPDSGRILYNGQPVGPSFRNHVGYLPEERGLYKKITVDEVLLYLAALKGKSASEIKPLIGPWLERMELSEYREQKVEALSKGMQQKLQFVSTVLHQPDIIILDEIFSGLDPLNMELIKDCLLDLKREGRTILFSTHVMEQAEKLCDSICMISGGKKVLDGTLVNIKKQFGTNTVRLDIEGDGGFVRTLPGVADVSEFNNYMELTVDESADAQQLLKSIVDRVTVRRFEIVEPSLYSIFIKQSGYDPMAAEEEAAV